MHRTRCCFSNKTSRHFIRTFPNLFFNLMFCWQCISEKVKWVSSWFCLLRNCFLMSGTSKRWRLYWTRRMFIFIFWSNGERYILTQRSTVPYVINLLAQISLWEANILSADKKIFANFMQPGNQICPVPIVGHTNSRSLKSHVSKLRFNIILSLRLGVGTYLINVRHVYKVHRSLYYSSWTFSDGFFVWRSM
jgi:hypothetical protein